MEIQNELKNSLLLIL